MMLRLLCWVVITLVLAIPSRAQENVGAVLGRVIDATGAVAPNVQIRAVNVDTGIQAATITNEAGNYLIPSLPPGSYRLTADCEGFKRVVIEGIAVQIQQQSRADIHLEVGAVREVVSVSAPATLVNTDNATLGQVVGNRTSVELPLANRNMAQVALLGAGVVNTPNVTAVIAQEFGGGVSITANGMRPSSNQFSVDGGNINVGLYNYPSFIPVPDAVEEFKVRTGNYSAEFGGFGGAHVDYSLKSGTNQFHGGLWEFLGNDALNARNAFAGASKPAFRQNQFGGIVSGPVIHNKTFFMVSYQGTRSSNQQILQGTVPTDAQRAGDLRYTVTGAAVAPFRDPLTGTPFPNNAIPLSRFSPTMAAVLQFYPTANQSGAANYRRLLAAPNDTDMVLAKMDQSFGSDRISGHYAIQDNSNYTYPALIRDFGQNTTIRGQNAKISDTHIFTPTMVLDARISWNRDFLFQYTPRNAGDNNYDARSALHMVIPSNFGPGQIQNNIPYFSATSFAPVGDITGGSPLRQPDEVQQFAAGLTWVRGKHNLKFGTDLRHARSVRFRTQVLAGSMSYLAGNPGGTGYDAADFLLGLPYQSQISNTPITADLRQWRTDFYIADDWTVTPKLTLNLGLRYEFNFPLNESGGRIPLFNFTSPGTFRSLKPGEALFDANYKDFAPRFGLAYRLRENTVIRAGYGIFYSNPKLLGLDLAAINPPLINQYSFFSTATAPLIASNAFPIGVVASGGVPTPYAFQTNAQTPYVQSWSFNVQRSIGSTTVVEVGYAGNMSLHGFRTMQLNVPLPGPGTIQTRRPLPGWGQVGYEQSDSNSSYQGLLTRFERRFAGGFSMLATYTFSRTIDLSSDEQVGGTIDPLNLNRDRGLADIDHRHHLAVSYIYELPFGPGKPLLTSPGPVSYVLRGWQLSGITSFTSGLPLSVSTAASPANMGLPAGSNRPNRICDGNFAGGGNAGRWFDTGCFVLPAQFTIGNAGRNILIGPATRSWDFAILRRFAIHERHAVQFRADMFNAFNNVNLGNPGVTLGTPTFGQILSAGSARMIQFALKYNF